MIIYWNLLWKIDTKLKTCMGQNANYTPTWKRLKNYQGFKHCQIDNYLINFYNIFYEVHNSKFSFWIYFLDLVLDRILMQILAYLRYSICLQMKTSFPKLQGKKTKPIIKKNIKCLVLPKSIKIPHANWFYISAPPY